MDLQYAHINMSLIEDKKERVKIRSHHRKINNNLKEERMMQDRITKVTKGFPQGTTTSEWAEKTAKKNNHKETKHERINKYCERANHNLKKVKRVCLFFVRKDEVTSASGAAGCFLSGQLFFLWSDDSTNSHFCSPQVTEGPEVRGHHADYKVCGCG